MTEKAATHPDVQGFTPETLNVRDELRTPSKPVHTLPLGRLSIEVRQGRDTLWFVVRRPGKGGVALRAIPSTGPAHLTSRRRIKNEAHYSVETPAGVFGIILKVEGEALMRVTVTLKPAVDLLVAFWPRDLYPLDAHDDPTKAKGCVEAAQRGVNTGQCYFCLDRPAFGTVLYIQNLTALNEFFVATKTKPDGVVGGEWPELGYQPPTAPLGNSPPTNPLPKGKSVVISDALIAFSDTCADRETTSASQFIDMLAEIYPHLGKPEPQFRDWMGRAQKTITDLERAPDAAIEHYGHTYLHPYTGAEYPDSMVQLSVVAALRDYGRTHGRGADLADQLTAGVPRFFDKDLGIIRRYLPNVGKDKNKNAVDSWYLYHPLMNLGRLALTGEEKARELFLGSMDYAVKAAKHFKYVWPIQYDVRDFSVLVASRSDQGLGQTDVGGLYAYVMLQAYELTDELSYLKEAKLALSAVEGARFELAYQTNITAWGAVACVKLWALERDPKHLQQSLVFVAGFLHNCELWNSEIGHAKHYTNFFGVTCLHDAPYMAAYECFESFAAFEEYLAIGREDVPPSARMLLSEYRRFTPDRAWFFYPDALPPDAIAKDKIRNGHIDRKLSFPLEDIYGDGQPAGQVGQEIYGCGGAFIFASRCFAACGDAPFMVFSDYPTIIEGGADPAQIVVRSQGPPGMTGRFRLIRKPRRAMPRISVTTERTDEAIAPRARSEDLRDFSVSADEAFRISWSPMAKIARAKTN